MKQDFFKRDRICQSPVALYITVGPSRLGKSRWANRKIWLDRHTVILCRDDFRRAVGVEYHAPFDPFLKVTQETAVRALLLRGFSVIVDGTHLTEECRAPWVRMAQKLENVDLYFARVTVPTDWEKWRQVAEEDNFQWEVIREQINRYQGLTKEEWEAGHVFDIPNLIDEEPCDAS